MTNTSLKLSWLIGGLLCSGVANASQTDKQWLTGSEFISPIDVAQTDHKQLAVSEALGIALLDEQGRSLSTINSKSEHLDFRWLPNSQSVGVLSTLNKNSGNIELIKVDFKRNRIEKAYELSSDKTAFDALCLGSSSEHIELFTVDVNGIVSQVALNTANEADWQLSEIRHFAAGLNMKSCAVNDLTESLYIAEENIGVWQYSTNPELEIIRELLQLPEGLAVEYLDTTASGDVSVVSPSTNQLWLLEQNNHAFKPFELPKNIAPKTVQLHRSDKNLIAHVFDDETSKNIKINLGKHKLPLKKKNEQPIANLIPFAQTTPVASHGDAADDPEIWINSTTPSNSLVYGTDKKSGLNVYDLNGNLLKTLPVGRVNNVDIRYGVKFNSEVVDIAAASNRTNKSISLFKIDQKSGLPTLLADIKTDLADPYGLCLGQYDDELFVWINDTDGRFQKYDITFKNQKVTGQKTLEWTVPSQPEGCVSDDANQRLFYGEESMGVWLKDLKGNQPDKLISGLNEQVEADIEGMSLYRLNGKQYLVVSSQGNNRYAVYSVDNNNEFLGVFKVGVNWASMIDGASETDGLAVTSSYLGEALPNGLLVVQDGHNVMSKSTQNFKLVDGSLLRDWILNRVEK
ncbi:3-phytase [Pseudoalteromonas phenolica]|uniref:phytase n=1 Tax=Pseudoalteromonas phenolica TaxID=161398 RepID=UPI00110BE5E5|nr:phytase [Pseudoalteromonas phenolica]TMN90428.1 3-phytase [Pseudoalteromonas phenolica]